MQKFVETLVTKHDTNCPIELADKLDITINYTHLGNDTLGLSQVEKRIKIIHINDAVKEENKNFIIAHEIYHILKHDHYNTHFLKRTGFNVVDKLEREANEFATLLLANQFDSSCYDTVTSNDIIRECGIPEEYSYYLKQENYAR